MKLCGSSDIWKIWRPSCADSHWQQELGWRRRWQQQDHVILIQEGVHWIATLSCCSTSSWFHLQLDTRDLAACTPFWQWSAFHATTTITCSIRVLLARNKIKCDGYLAINVNINKWATVGACGGKKLPELGYVDQTSLLINDVGELSVSYSGIIISCKKWFLQIPPMTTSVMLYKVWKTFKIKDNYTITNCIPSSSMFVSFSSSSSSSSSSSLSSSSGE